MEDGRISYRKVEPEPDDDDLPPKGCAAKLAKLPTDPDALLAHVRGDRHWIDLPKGDDEGGADREHPDARAFRVLSLYLAQRPLVSPRLEAAIFRAMSKVPGVRVEPGVADAVGRRGIGVYRDTGGAGGRSAREYQVLDPTTYRYLGLRVVWLEDEWFDGPGSSLISRKGDVYTTALLASAIVDESGDRP